MMLLCAGVFLFSQPVYARHYTESHMLDDFFKDDGAQAGIFAATTIASVFIPYLSVAAGVVSAATASAGIVISSAVNIGSQIAVAAGADPETTMIVGGVVGGLASGITNVAQAPVGALNTMQTIGTIALHTAVWSTQAGVTVALTQNGMDPTLAGLCGSASSMAVQTIGSWGFNQLSGNTAAYMNPSDMSVGFWNGQSSSFGASLLAMAYAVPGLAASTAARYGVTQALGDDATQPWAAPLINMAGSVGLFLANYGTGAVATAAGGNPPASLMRTGAFGADLVHELLTAGARYGVQTGFAYANDAVYEASSEGDGNWAMPAHFLLNTAEGFFSMAAAGGVSLLYSTATGAQPAAFGDIFRNSLGAGLANSMPFYNSEGNNASSPEVGGSAQMYRYNNYMQEMLSFNTAMPREVPEQLETALAGADEAVRDLILAIYLNPSMPSTGYNALNMASHFASTGASQLGQSLGGQASNLIYGASSPYHIYNGMVPSRSGEERYFEKSPAELQRGQLRGISDSVPPNRTQIQNTPTISPRETLPGAPRVSDGSIWSD